jgi:transcriptional regulator
MPERRDFLLALSALTASAEENGESLYIPERHAEKDRALLLDFFEEFSFAMVITAKGGIRTTNVPTLLERSSDGWGKVWWHLAKSNPQNDALGGSEEALVVFHGPHAYISPNWYSGQAAVPTWNFAVVNVSGKVRRVDDDEAFARSLERLVKTNEGKYGGGKVWDYAKMTPAYLKGMRQGIVAYEMTIEKVEGKFKLGQERSAADRANVLEGLKKPQGRDILALTRDYYARLKP